MSYDPLDIAKQNEQREQDAKRQQERDEQEAADYRWLLEFRQGRRLLWRMLEEAGVFRSVYSESHAEMSLREGIRTAGLRLLARITRHAPEKYNVMQTENVPDARRVDRGTEG